MVVQIPAHIGSASNDSPTLLHLDSTQGIRDTQEVVNALSEYLCERWRFGVIAVLNSYIDNLKRVVKALHGVEVQEGWAVVGRVGNVCRVAVDHEGIVQRVIVRQQIT